MIYTCAQGDTWDSIAYKAYSNEMLFPAIMEANRQYSDVVVFDGGEQVAVPERVEGATTIIAAPWQDSQAIRIIKPAWG